MNLNRDVKSLNFRCLSVFIIMIIFTTGVTAFEISGEYTEEGQRWLCEHWGENITIGDVARIAYTTENYEKIKAGVYPELLEGIWSQPYFWGSSSPGENPGFPYGASVWDENGQVDISKLNLSQKRDMGIEDAVTDSSGYVVIGHMDQTISQGELKSFHRDMPENLDRFTYDLLWGDTQDSLKLTIFAPDEVMGPYYDDSDGIVNGRIFLQVSRPDGIEPGDWYAVVEGKEVKGIRKFMLLVL